MKSIKLLLLISLNCFSLFYLSSPVNPQTESILEKINRTGLLKVGIREDAVPFGYRDVNGDLTGLCLDFVEVFREKLKEKLNKQAIAIKIYKSTLFNRFELASDKIVDLECGPNTIRIVADYEIQFSRPFFLTGTQFLINADQSRSFNPNSNLANVEIGVLRDTSNEQLIAKQYPSASLVKFQGVTGRYRGIQALRGGQIDAFASDGILLIGEALVQGLGIGGNYLLVPQYPLECQGYGLILPNNDPEWLSFVNSVIQASLTKKIFEDWFGEILPRIEQIESFCREKQ